MTLIPATNVSSKVSSSRRVSSRASASLSAAVVRGLESLEGRILFSGVNDIAVLPDVPISAAEVRALDLEVLTINGKKQYAYDGQYVARFDVEKGSARQRANLQTLINANNVVSGMEFKYGGAVQIQRKLGDDGLFLVHAPKNAPLAQVNKALSTLPGFKFVEPNSLVWAQDRIPNDTSYGLQWSLPRIQAPVAWDTGVGTNEQIVVAVIDTGIDYNHPDLAGAMWNNPGETPGDGIDNDANGFVDDFYGYNFAGVRNANPYDDNRHGTHVAGTIAGTTNNARGVAGVSWGAKLMALKFLNSAGTGSTADAAAAVNYMSMMLERGTKVLVSNNSWTGPAQNATLRTAIDRYGAAGGLFVAAAGNNNTSTPQFPAGYTASHVLSVAASDRNDNRPFFSNFGSSWVDLAAPGVDIYSTTPGNTYTYLSGTSMAAPHVSGAAALLWDAAGSSTARTTIQNAILGGVDTLSQWSGLVSTGGRLNVSRSLNLLDLKFRVTSATPAPGALVDTPLTQFSVNFTSSYRAASVQASDFTVNGIPATSFTQVDADTLTFNFATTPLLTSGAQSMSIAPGAIQRNGDSRGVDAWTSSFIYDAVKLQVVLTTPAAGGTVPFPITSFIAQFNEPINPASVNATDLIVSTGTVTAATLINPTTIRYDLLGVDDESIGVWTAVLPEGAISDLFGFGNEVYVGALGIDGGTVTLSTQPSAAANSSFVQQLPQTLTGVINPAGDSDEFSIDLDADQTLTAVVIPQNSLHVSVELLSPSGQVVAFGFADDIGQDALLQSAQITEAGRYTLVVFGENGSAGSYSIDVYLNAGIENEGHDLPTNGTRGSAQDLDESFGPIVGTGADRVAIVGTLEPTGTIGSDRATYHSEQFEGPLGAAWALWSSNPQGRIQPSTTFGGYLSPGALVMDRTPSGAFTNNEAVWTVNLTGLEQPVLNFAHADLGDEEHILPSSFTGRRIGDGVSISVDGTTWYRVYQPGNLATGVWDPVSVNLAAFAQTNGLTLGAGVQIKFQQYDNLSLPADGRAYDAVNITALAPPEDWYTFTGNAGQSISLGLDVAGATNSGLTLELYDAAGNLVTTGVASDPAFDELAENVLLTTSGQYGVRITNGSSTPNDYVLVVTRGANLDAEPNDTNATGQELGLGGAVIGTVGDTDPADVYRFVARAGDVLTITTATPGDGPFLMNNTLDPSVELIDPDGFTVLTASDGATDSRNVVTSYQVQTDGIYVIRVSADQGDGAYVLNVTGQTGGAVPFTVTGSTPTDGNLIVTPVSDITIDFSHALAVGTVQASDLLVNGQPAVSVTLVDKNTAVFTLASPLTDGTYTLQLATGSVRSVANADIAAFGATFTVDLTAPRVLESSVSQGSYADVGTLVYTARFSEALRAEQIDFADVLLQSNGTTYPADSILYDDQTLTLQATFSNLPEAPYSLTLRSGADAFEDLAGLDLDGEPTTWPLPALGSGNGVEGGDFVVNFGLEPSTSAFPTQLDAIAPLGSMAYTKTVSSLIDFQGDVDRFTLNLQAGQVVSVTVRSTGGALVPTLMLLDPSGSNIGTAGASSTTGNVVSASMLATGAGTYTFVVSGTGTGTYDLTVALNSVNEEEAINGVSNNTLGTSQSIDNAFTDLPDGASRGLVSGQLNSGGQDWYGFTMTGQGSITVLLSSSQLTQADIEIYNAAGERLTQGVQGSTNAVAAVQNVGIAAGGTYYVRVLLTGGGAGGAYTLLVARNSTFDLEDNNQTIRAQDIGQRGTAIGFVGAGDALDLFKVSVQAGNPLLVTTATPGDQAGLFDNTLDARLELYNPWGTLVASASAGAADGRNAVLSHVALASGVYVVRVAPENGTGGEYVLNVTGQAGGFLPLTVTGIDPVDNAILRVVPGSVTLDFSHPLLASSVQVSDVLIDGQPAASFSFVDPNTVTFNFPGLGEGVRVLSVGANTLTNLDGTSNTAFSSSFRIDVTAPAVVASSISSGQFFGIGSLVYTARFSETLVAGQIDASDVTLRGTTSGQFFTPTSVVYDVVTSTLTASYAGLLEEGYTLTLNSADGAFEDLAGINLDGEATWPLPVQGSGNGIEGGNFVVGFGLETIEAAFPVPLSAVNPSSSLVHRGSVTNKIDFAADEDAFTINLAGGQTISLLVQGSGGLAPGVRLVNAAGTVVGSAAASSGASVALAQSIAVSASGTYRIVVSSATGSTGNYTMTAQLNGAFEAEETGGATNDSIATAQSIDGAFLAVGGTMSHAGVTGSLGSAAVDRFAVFSDSFETGFGPGWTTARSNVIGRTQITNLYGAAAGQFAMTMDVNPASGSFARNEANWTVNVAGLNAPRLSFSHADLGDEEHTLASSFTNTPNGDGVAISVNGTNWRRIFQPVNQVENVWTTFDFDLVALAASFGMSLNGMLHVKFVQYDNLGLPADGRGWDNVQITAAGTSDHYAFNAVAGQTVSFGAHGTGAGALDLKLFNATGLELAGGRATGAGATEFDTVLDEFTIPTTGRYTIRIAASLSASENYTLVALRNGAVAVESASPVALGSMSSALGAIGSVSDVDAYTFSLTAGQSVSFATRTFLQTLPPAGTLLNPTLTLLNASNEVVAFNDNEVGGDGRNALLTFTPTTSGVFTLRIASTAGTGAYVVERRIA